MNKKIRVLLIVTFLLNFFLHPVISLAGNYNLSNGTQVHYEGLVPCGKSQAVADETEGGLGVEMPCQFCHLFVMAKGILDYLLLIIMIIAVFFIVFGGAKILLAGADPKLVTEGKQTIFSVVKGLVIIFVAWIVVNTIFLFIGVADWTGLREGWFQINCPIILPSTAGGGGGGSGGIGGGAVDPVSNPTYDPATSTFSAIDDPRPEEAPSLPF